MANADGLFLVLVAALIGIGLVGGTFALLVYGIRARDARRGFVASLVALAFAGVAVLLSAPFWMVVLTGRDTHGDPLQYGQSLPLVAVVAIEALAVAAAILGAVRQKRRLASR